MKSIPSHLTAPLRQALEHQRAGNWSEAGAIYAAVIDEVGEHEVVLTSYGAAILAQDRSAEAAEILERAVAVNAEYPQALIMIGEAYRQLARFDEALEHIRRGLGGDGMPTGYCTRGS